MLVLLVLALALGLGLKLLFLLLLLLLLLRTLGHDSLLHGPILWMEMHLTKVCLCCRLQRLDAAFKLGQLGGAAVGPLIDELRREAGVKADW